MCALRLLLVRLYEWLSHVDCMLMRISLPVHACKSSVCLYAWMICVEDALWHLVRQCCACWGHVCVLVCMIVCICMCVCVHVIMYVCMRVCIYMCMYVCMHVCICVCICVYVGDAFVTCEKCIPDVQLILKRTLHSTPNCTWWLSLAERGCRQSHDHNHNGMQSLFTWNKI